jgi:sulfatase maturation enzyme AslB (radical SAM superfamily)
MYIKPVLPFIETMATQACNLSCKGCTNYSDLAFKGYVPWADSKNWIKSWLEKIDITEFGIIGGEPLLNPEIDMWLYGCRELMPDNQLRFTTNGLLIKSVPDLLSTIEDIGNIIFKITVHGDNAELEEKIQEIMLSRPWQPVNEHGINRWRLNNGIRLQINRPNNFIVTYKGSYDNMMPYYSDPVKAFKLCIQQTCPLLWNGKIYKCSTAGLLDDVLQKVNPATRNHWEEFIDHGLSPDDDYNDIMAFIDNFGKPNAKCAQCPDDAKFLINHKDNILAKKYTFKKYE